MTKKHFIAFARMIAEMKGEEKTGRKFDVSAIDYRIKKILTQFNPRFDENKWNEFIEKEKEYE